MDMPRSGPALPETHILLIEDNPDDVSHITQILTEEGDLAFNLEHRVNLAEGINRLSKGGIDVVLLDLGLPDSWGLDTVVKFHPFARHLPVIVLSGLEDIGSDIEAIQGGAQDFIVKWHMDHHILIRSILHAIQRMKTYETLHETWADQPESAGWDRAGAFKALSREIHRPLTIIKGALDGLKDNMEEPLAKTQAEYVRMADHHLMMVQSILKSVEDLCRLEFGKIRLNRFWVDPAELVVDLCASLRPQTARRQIELEQDIPVDSPKIFGDPGLITLVLAHLVCLALNFAKKKIIVRLRSEESAFIDASHAPAPGGIRFSVLDDGPPIPPEEIGLLFNPMALLRRASIVRNGLDHHRLGPAICKKIVELHEGRIWVANSEQGNEYHVVLPCFDERQNFRSLFAEALKKAGKEQRTLKILRLTIENLKQIEAQCEAREIEKMYGAIEERLASVLSVDESICRLQGSIAILSRLGPEEARMMQLRVLERTADCVCLSREGKIPVGRRIGMAVYAQDGIDPEELFFQALLKSRFP